MGKYTQETWLEMLKKRNGCKGFWEVFNITKSDHIRLYYFDSYTEAKDYFDGCIARKSKSVLITEFDKTPSGYHRTKTINEYPKRK